MHHLLRLCFTCALFSWLPAQAETLKVGYFDLPPHVSSNTAAKSSAAIQYFDQIAAEMGVQVNYQAYPLTQLLQLLETGQLDAILFLARNPAREKIFSYPQQPIISTQPIFVVSQLSSLQKITDITSEHGLKIGVWKGGYFSRTLANCSNQLIRMGGANVAAKGLDSVVKGHVDAFYSPDRYSMEYQAKKYKKRKLIRIIPNTSETIDLYTTFSTQAGAVYLKSYEAALRKVKAQQSYETLLDKFIGSTDPALGLLSQLQAPPLLTP